MIGNALSQGRKLWIFGGTRRERHEAVRRAAAELGVRLCWLSAPQCVEKGLQTCLRGIAAELAQQPGALVIMDWERIAAWYRLYGERFHIDSFPDEFGTSSPGTATEEVLIMRLGAFVGVVSSAVIVTCATLVPIALRWFEPAALLPLNVYGASWSDQGNQDTVNSDALQNATGGELRYSGLWLRMYRDNNGALARIRRMLLPTTTELATWRRFGVAMPRCVLVHGPPASGKTALVYAFADLAAERGIPCHLITRSNLYSGYLGETERELRQLFRPVSAEVGARRPILCFDDIDLFFSCGRSQGAQQTTDDALATTDRFTSRLLGTLLSEIDGALESNTKDNLSAKLLLTATELDALDAALLRPGRCDACIALASTGAPEPRSIRPSRLETRTCQASGTAERAPGADKSPRTTLWRVRAQRLASWERLLGSTGQAHDVPDEKVGAENVL